MSLDWDLPPYPPPPAQGAKPLRVTVVPAEPPPPAKALDARAYLERALLYLELRQYIHAMADFERTNTFEPELFPWEEVVRAYSRAIERYPRDPEAYHQRARALERLGKWDEAVTDHGRAIQLNPHAWSFRLGRGQAYAELGQWARAAAEFAHVVESKEATNWEWYHHALACLQTGDADGYRRACATMLERLGQPGGSAKPDITALTCGTCALAAGAVADPARVVRLAEEVLAKNPKSHEYLCVLGAAHYRAGQFDAAVQRLTEAAKLRGDESLPYEWLLLGMTHRRLGHADEARQYLDQAVQWTERAQAEKLTDPRGGIRLAWNWRLTLQLLRREAEALMTGSQVPFGPPAPIPEKKDQSRAVTKTP
jgi:tetratricopeptide (TPR) repeat protein